MKKKYVKPEMTVIECEPASPLLSGSDNTWWVPPAEKEGCETPYWCPDNKDD